MINKVPVKKLIEFGRFSERRQTTFANKLKVPKKIDLDENSNGGDYWIRSTSGLARAFKENSPSVIKEKIEDLSTDFESTEFNNTKIMFKRNLEILHNYEDFDFSIWRPSNDLKFLSKSNSPLLIKDVPIQILPHHIFSFKNKGELSVGGIWFVVWLEGFKPSDLGTFSDALFRYISHLYSREHKVNPTYCIIVDALSKETVNYQQVLEGKIPSSLNTTIDRLKKYL
ncbi:hypothetical protein [Mucilaginibacter celer]|uniref:Uncharacterized protein n=1 Tax=Mucilaginibacter celer TaxID=2305508 RepID=A0A494VUF2_9SPHI|nr:hypothetical protein [Mucilaginibacter celer]AYL94582.1 hypothetical protein HYN43_004385 [Mucilaginibacter celer]